ncbi:hypothetical protein EMIHUDRAFT_204045 [Emiliania huxleyi CCMP1516]|uniref:(S)-ureidoglycine aminohydrolase cupin domain-containing protein n=2 Tax=Emiliania huxleyi TaxID=2903 RepID=A0A0D3K0V5_EMIH1|nr:hypothetical protein EMIHUDRAFT_204045 [Emiliania huxleyi CCMP1516]EOD29390.1 hypothetical protein EMIHUDRAFT_204045 [Emiliania huxleyi CCMP1516]|eukprot:XP_005781819.1 hypothetical protein EMIHUDRAFT_204045 [Emiliania huxleyi CCMP1516]
MLSTLFASSPTWLPASTAGRRNVPASSVRTGGAALSAELAAKQAWLARTQPSWGPPSQLSGSVEPTVAAAPPVDEAAAKQAWLARTQPDEPAWRGQSSPAESAARLAFVHAPLSYFALDKLASKGTRRAGGSLVDVGEPEDWSRPIAKDAWSGARAGSWACSEGGWDSPKLRPTTETFLVLEGWGCVTDVDGTQHSFGPNDVVVLPRHWSGRWDVARFLHKVWVVHDHPDVPAGADGVVRAVVAPAWPHFGAPLHEGTIYDGGHTRVGVAPLAPGSVAVSAAEAGFWSSATAKFLWILDGVLFLTNADGSSRRCVAGDTAVLPAGWTGLVDTVQPARVVWVDVD